MLINNSPLTPTHSLICPSVEENLPQVLTLNAIELGVNLLRCLEERKYRIGFNSPGALASVNHLHLHLIQLDCQLYVENAVSIFIIYILGCLSDSFILLETNSCDRKRA